MYEVLANKATNTIVWIGWVHALLDIDWNRGVICRFNQPGFAAGDSFDGRRRAGSKAELTIFATCPRISYCLFAVPATRPREIFSEGLDLASVLGSPGLGIRLYV